MARFGRIFCISISVVSLAAARSYSVDGLVVAVNSPVFTVAHRPIPGYMQAMTMEFRAASPSELDEVRPGLGFVSYSRMRLRAAFESFRQTSRICPSGPFSRGLGNRLRISN